MLKHLIPTGLVILSLSFVSCALGLIEPEKGVTGKFFREDGRHIVNLADYDFGRLQQGHGLCIFSFKFTGKKGNYVDGWTDQIKEGIRVWEYKFRMDDPDTKWLEKRIFIWAQRSVASLGAKRGYECKVHFPFRKGQIIYAGRLLVSFPDGGNVESHFEEDLSKWFEQYSEGLGDISVDSLMMIGEFDFPFQK
jgi:hypothetical protein